MGRHTLNGTGGLKRQNKKENHKSPRIFFRAGKDIESILKALTNKSDFIRQCIKYRKNNSLTSKRDLSNLFLRLKKALEEIDMVEEMANSLGIEKNNSFWTQFNTFTECLQQFTCYVEETTPKKSKIPKIYKKDQNFSYRYQFHADEEVLTILREAEVMGLMKSEFIRQKIRLCAQSKKQSPQHLSQNTNMEITIWLGKTKEELKNLKIVIDETLNLENHPISKQIENLKQFLHK